MADHTDPAIVTIEPITVAVIRETVAMEALAQFYDRVYGVVAGVIAAQDAAIAGPALGIYYGVPTHEADVAAGFPITGSVTPADSVVQAEIPGGVVGQLLYVGGYEGLPGAYERLAGYLVEQGHQPGPLMWEQYLTEPTPTADPATMETLICWTVAPS